jgi:hypothetical protein
MVHRIRGIHVEYVLYSKWHSQYFYSAKIIILRMHWYKTKSARHLEVLARVFGLLGGGKWRTIAKEMGVFILPLKSFRD